MLQSLGAALALVLLALLAGNQWDALAALEWHLRPLPLLFSGICIAGGWLVEIQLWRRLVGIFGGRLDYARAVPLWFASAIVRYIPGNVWQPLSLVSRCRAAGVRAETTVASLTFFHVVQLLAVVPIAVAYLVTWGPTSGLAEWTTVSPWWVLPAALPVAMFLVRPHTLVALANAVLRIARREPLPLALSPSRLLALLGMSLGAWLSFAAGFTLLAVGLLPADIAVAVWLPHLMAAYPLAFAVGFVSLITPGGLAVREGALIVLLAPVVGGAQAMVIALGMRVWELVLDAVGAAAALAWLAARPVAGRPEGAPPPRDHR